MNEEVKKRLTWIKLYEETDDAGLVCRRCGISRPTLRKWWRRYQELGEAGLASQSRRPNQSPNQKVFPDQEQWILQLRRNRHLGARRIQHELIRLYECHLGLATIQKLLQKHAVSPLRRKRNQQRYKRYQRPVPGNRVQMDTIKIARGIFQYTAIDDCSRFLVAAVYSRRTAANTLDFIARVIEQMPFPIQRFQTDNGCEFAAYDVQDRLLEWVIKFRPNRPASPHLNGKVKRVQQTILSEFYTTIELPINELQDHLEAWQFYYNWQRVHGSTGKTPIEKCSDLSSKTPYRDESVMLLMLNAKSKSVKNEPITDRLEIETMSMNHTDESWFHRFIQPHAYGWSNTLHPLELIKQAFKRSTPDQAVACFGALCQESHEILMDFAQGYPTSEQMWWVIVRLLRRAKSLSKKGMVLIWDNAPLALF